MLNQHQLTQDLIVDQDLHHEEDSLPVYLIILEALVILEEVVTEVVPELAVLAAIYLVDLTLILEASQMELANKENRD